MQNGKKLTLFEAACTITGYGLGGGVMAVPYLASLNGILPFILLLVLAFTMSVIFHLMLAEMMMRDSSCKQLIEIFDKYLFKGRGGAVFTWAFFILILAAFITNLSAYIAGGGEILRDLLGIPLLAGHTITYLIAAGVVFFGLKVMGMSEKFAVLAIMAIVAVLFIGSLQLGFKPVWIQELDYQKPMALFGMIMFCFVSLFSIPQAVEGLSWDKKKVPKAVFLGLFINLSIVTAVTIAAICVSEQVTRIAITGWSQALGNWAFISGSLFVLLAMLTSYWSISFAMTVIVKERLKWGDRLSWLVATLPTFLIVITGVTDFMGFMRLAGGAIALIVAILIIPTYRGILKNGDIRNPEWKLGKFGNSFIQALIVICFLLMSAGSLIQVG
jgi:amino acid permease